MAVMEHLVEVVLDLLDMKLDRLEKMEPLVVEEIEERMLVEMEVLVDYVLLVVLHLIMLVAAEQVVIHLELITLVLVDLVLVELDLMEAVQQLQVQTELVLVVELVVHLLREQEVEMEL